MSEVGGSLEKRKGVEVVEFTKASSEELEMLRKRESLKRSLSRKDWALEVLNLVQAHSNEWLKLEGKHNGANATRYLKPLGIKYSITEIEPNGFATIYVKWEK
jgi:hypothetical protein